ncbi:Ssu72-like protein [Eremomyces bilateralis CBS 781.70]|uniref:RNA polymerase II subunit A C-terminal domain phosphatase SSU72 n=1 Tax=Eremomyces bilateralis CBS 781.70 TaxID=1392243 RepID=A0A6G1GE63_9PEZI|nr:Ssu72-like protein [Eremomyces bilateralis CBS 781.70]KAF1816181.1 Ssu72-like protein [Eremomyces bilateralis CBS 781.70]
MATDPRLRSSQAPPPPPPPPPSEPVISSLDGASDSPIPTGAEKAISPAPPQPDHPRNSLIFCTVCASNNNRSMEAHRRLSPFFPTISFGTGSLVRLPGPSITQPNIYSFNKTAYARIHDELASKDPRLYRANGLLPMLERNKSIKWGPERWQDWPVGVPRIGERYATELGNKGTEAGVVDIVVTCEEKCWDSVLEDLHARGGPLNRPVHIINVDIKDSHEEALIGGEAILDLATRLNEAATKEREEKGIHGWGDGRGVAREVFDERVPEIIAEWQERWPRYPALWSLAWF